MQAIVAATTSVAMKSTPCRTPCRRAFSYTCPRCRRRANCQAHQHDSGAFSRLPSWTPKRRRHRIDSVAFPLCSKAQSQISARDACYGWTNPARLLAPSRGRLWRDRLLNASLRRSTLTGRVGSLPIFPRIPIALASTLMQSQPACLLRPQRVRPGMCGLQLSATLQGPGREKGRRRPRSAGEVLGKQGRCGRRAYKPKLATRNSSTLAPHFGRWPNPGR